MLQALDLQFLLILFPVSYRVDVRLQSIISSLMHFTCLPFFEVQNKCNVNKGLAVTGVSHLACACRSGNKIEVYN